MAGQVSSLIMWSSSLSSSSSSSSGFGGNSEQFVTFWQPAPARALTERPARVNYWLHLCSLACVWPEGVRRGKKNAENKHYRIPRKNVSYAPKFFLKRTITCVRRTAGKAILVYVYYKIYTSVHCSASVRPGVEVNDTRGFFAKSIKCINHADIDPIIFGVIGPLVRCSA